MMIETPLYRITLGDDWIAEPSSTNAQKLFTSRRHAAALSILSQELEGATSKDTVDAAKYMLAMRLDAENKIAQANNNPINISEPRLVAQPWGATVAYYGSDSQGRQFYYSAAVWPRQMMALFVESNRLNEAQVRDLMSTVMSGVEFNGAAV